MLQVVKVRAISQGYNIILFIDAINYKLDRMENRHGRLLVSHALSLVTASRFGLSENELLDILSCDEQV